MKTRLIPLLILFLSAICILNYCKNESIQEYIFPDPGTLPSGLKGTWLETTSRIDTLIFSNDDQRNSLILKNNFKNIKFIFAYPYEILGDSIFIMDPTSSNPEIADGINFYFKLDDPNRTITIGNFTYRLSAKDPTLIFKKIK